MTKIGGNAIAELQIRTTVKNEIGERTSDWSTVQTLKGFLDYSSGEANRDSYNAKTVESTHIFICDYTQLIQGENAEKYRLKVNGCVYDVVYIDNPMNLNFQLEISLKYTGGAAK